jgi:hypothetical protein
MRRRRIAKRIVQVRLHDCFGTRVERRAGGVIQIDGVRRAIHWRSFPEWQLAVIVLEVEPDSAVP